MNLEITDEERDFLNELFEEKQERLIEEINHTDTRDFKSLLKKKIEVLEGLMRKIGQRTR
ncbi:MAG TPA: hypothetical protein VFU37_07460 [Pyrinomonadaceae bacterium]|nr:hypothetical protein [Pyrinomonadaceae bacterium]